MAMVVNTNYGAFILTECSIHNGTATVLNVGTNIFDLVPVTPGTAQNFTIVFDSGAEIRITINANYSGNYRIYDVNGNDFGGDTWFSNPGVRDIHEYIYCDIGYNEVSITSGKSYTTVETVGRTFAWNAPYPYNLVFGSPVVDYPVSYSLTHVTYDSNNPPTIASNVTEETARTFTLFVDENYDIDNNTISVTNCSYEYETTADGKTIYLHLYAPTGTVVITAAAGTDDPYSGEGDGTIGGADVGVPGLPTLGNVSAGLFSLFAPTAGQMNALADFLWTDIDFSQVISAPDQLSALNAIANIFQELGEAFKREIANPAKMIFGLSIIPSQGLAIGGAANVKIGFVDTGVSMNVLTNRYFSVDCGGVTISPVCGDTFLDYAPYSKFSIYLPYIGVKPLDANDCVGHTISVKYNCDAVSGGCVCYVLKDGAVYYQYAGNVAMNLPLSSESWANTIAAAMNTASQLAAGIASGGVAGAGAAALQAASNVAANPSQLSPQIDHSGAVNGAAGYLGVQYPYIIREAVRFLDTAGMNEIKGYPSHYLTKLSNLSGYTEVLECHLTGIKATGNELTEIENLLKSGVII